MSSSYRSILLLLATMTIWGSTFVVTKDLIVDLPPFTAAFARVAIGALVLAPLAITRHRGGPRLPWRALVVMSFFGVTFYYLMFNLALKYTSAVQGALVQSSIPAATALAAVFWLRERATAVRWLGIGLSMLGVLIIFSGGGSVGAERPLLGNALMFASVLAWGFYTSLAKRVAAIDAIVTTACIMALGGAMLAPIAAYELIGYGWPTLSAKSWAGLVYLGAMASGAAYVLYNGALKHMDASQAGAYTNLIPVVGVLAGVILLEEPLSARAIIGGLVVMAGVWVASRSEKPASDAAVADAA
ncbi:MAG TPA: DMT family transporter [Steroidobacter sp.]|nr:DMT family transporter [Steroidobacter sp.]